MTTDELYTARTRIHAAIPMADWGKDHWSTLAYLEGRCVDYGGRLEADHLRCIRDRHPEAYDAKRRSTAFGTDVDASRYPTRLRNREQSDHDDYDCLADMVDEGLITELQDLLLERPSEREYAGDPNAVWRLTPRGSTVAGALRAHKGNGGTYATFRYQETP